MISRYWHWLYDILDRTDNYHNLLDVLRTTEFYSILPNDDNRVADGLALRTFYMESGGLPGPSLLQNLPCSVLETMIAIAQRIETDLYGSPYEKTVGEWFWILVDNLGLSDCVDSEWTKLRLDDRVEEALCVLLNRTYEFNGEGGLFPLNNPREDQKEVEIWYQMSAWIIENYPI